MCRQVLLLLQRQPDAWTPPYSLSFCRCKAEAFLQPVINHELSDSDIKIGDCLMHFRFSFQTDSELSEHTQSLFSEYISEWIALKSLFDMLAKRFIKNLWLDVPQETSEFVSMGLKAYAPAERIMKEVKLAL